MNADVTDVDAPVLLGCAYSDHLPAVDTQRQYVEKHSGRDILSYEMHKTCIYLLLIWLCLCLLDTSLASTLRPHGSHCQPMRLPAFATKAQDHSRASVG